MGLTVISSSPQALKKQPNPEVLHTRTIDREDFTLPEYGEPDSTRALIKIQDGCDVMCSFCLIPFARGHERSRLRDDVIREAEILVAGGYREIVLTGVNVGQYRQDETDLVGLIAQLEAVEGLERIRISSIEPTTITNALLDRMAASSKLCPYLHIPLQSGDDTVLSAMNRPYDVEEFTRLIRKAIAAIPRLGLGTDLMVGFPGETEEAFEHTLGIARELPFPTFMSLPIPNVLVPLPRSCRTRCRLRSLVNVQDYSRSCPALNAWPLQNGISDPPCPSSSSPE